MLIHIEETLTGINVGKFGNVVKCINLDSFTSSSKRFTLWTELHIRIYVNELCKLSSVDEHHAYTRMIKNLKGK